MMSQLLSYYLLMKRMRKNNNKKWLSDKKRRVYLQVSKAILVELEQAPFHNALERMLVSHESGESFQKLFRLNWETFNLLLTQFEAAYNRIPLLQQYLKPCVGYRLFSAETVLCIILHHFAANLDFDTLTLLTGGAPETVSWCFKHGLHVLLAVLQHWRKSWICFPASENAAEKLIDQYHRYCEQQNLVCAGSFIGFMDESIHPRE